MFNVKFADIGEGIHEGVIYKMNTQPENEVQEGETLFLVETDKVTAEIPSPVDGKVVKVNKKEGDEINVGEVIVVIDDGDKNVNTNMETEESVSETVTEQGSTSVVGEIEVSSEVIPASQEGVINKVKETIKKKVLATPVARKLAKDLKVDIQRVKGTGPAGRVMKADIYKAHEAESSVQNISENKKIVVKEDGLKEEKITRQSMSMIRRTIAEHMTKSKFTIPHTSVMDEVDVTDLVAFRDQAKEIAEEEGIKLTYLSLIIKAVVIALKEHPLVNASMDVESHELLIKHYINMGIAVDTPQGLMVPVIKDAESKSVFEIAQAVDSLSRRAKEKDLHIEELHGSTFTVTNYGAFGSSFGVPVINYPEAAVLGIGGISKKPVVIEDRIVIRYILPLSMSFDHRIMDGGDAGRFMTTLKKLLSTPQLLLLK